MDDVKELQKELNRINRIAGEMSDSLEHKDRILFLEIEMTRQYIENALKILGKAEVRLLQNELFSYKYGSFKSMRAS